MNKKEYLNRAFDELLHKKKLEKKSRFPLFKRAKNLINKLLGFLTGKTLLFDSTDKSRLSNVSIQLKKFQPWKSRNGYEFEIYPNDHPIPKKPHLNYEPHFHVEKKSEKINCRYFFDGTLHDCKNTNRIDKKIRKTLVNFVSDPKIKFVLIGMWNEQNPKYLANKKLKINFK